MAHIVKCRICGERFDTEKEPTFRKSNWYAHQKCYDEREAAKSQDEKDLDHLMEYCSRLYGRLFNYNQTLRLAKSYHEKNGFSFSGIERTMKYVYDIYKSNRLNFIHRINEINLKLDGNQNPLSIENKTSKSFILPFGTTS